MEQRNFNALEFRFMSGDDHQPSTPAVELGVQLRRERQRPRPGKPKGFKKSEVAMTKICSIRTLEKIELAKLPKVNPGIVLQLCDHYDTERTLTRHLKELAVATQAEKWIDAYTPGMEDWQWLYQQREDVASRIKVHDPVYIPMLVQHPDYVEAVYDSMKSGTGWQKVDLDVGKQLRLERQHRWMKSKRSLTCIMSESALLLNLGSDVMEAQKKHLLELARLPHVKILVAPLSAGRYDVRGIEFSMLEFDDGNEPVILMGSGHTSRYVSPEGRAGILYRKGFPEAESKSIFIEEFLK